MADTPQNGWWPDEAEATVTQMLFRKGKRVANIIKQGDRGWRAFSLLELNKSGTSGKPLGDTVPTRREAQGVAEAYAEEKA